MNKLFGITFGLVFGIGCASAMEGGRLQKANTLVHKSYKIPNSKGVAHVVVRNDGHTVGNPFSIELRPDCKPGNTKVEDLHVKDVYSSCKAFEGDFVVSPDGNKIQFQVYKPDNASLQKAVVNNIRLEKTPCLAEPEMVEFNLKKFCK